MQKQVVYCTLYTLQYYSTDVGTVDSDTERHKYQNQYSPDGLSLVTVHKLMTSLFYQSVILALGSKYTIILCELVKREWQEFYMNLITPIYLK